MLNEQLLDEVVLRESLRDALASPNSVSQYLSQKIMVLVLRRVRATKRYWIRCSGVADREKPLVLLELFGDRTVALLYLGGPVTNITEPLNTGHYLCH